jgi:hypothetical protein
MTDQPMCTASHPVGNASYFCRRPQGHEAAHRDARDEDFDTDDNIGSIVDFGYVCPSAKTGAVMGDTADTTGARMTEIEYLRRTVEALTADRDRLIMMIGQDFYAQCVADECFCCPEHPECGHHESDDGDD